MFSKIKISVIIPVYNGERFVRGCIESVLAQTQAATEIIVVNDGSIDNTESELAQFGKKINAINQPNRGRSAARNRGIEEAAGDYVAFLDIDDRFLPDHLKQLTDGSDNGRADIVYDWIGAPYCPDGNRVPKKPKGRTAWKHIEKYQLWVVTSMVRRDFLIHTQIRFNHDIEFGEDALFFKQLILSGAIVRYVCKRGCICGVHESNTTRDPRQIHNAMRTRDLVRDFIVQMQPPMTAKFLRAAQRGRNHTYLMCELACIYLNISGLFSIRDIQNMLQFSITKHMITSDRARALLAAIWIAIPFFRFSRFSRLIFGYTLFERRKQGGWE